ncbi:MAG: glycosyltransferase [Dysgonamonadaceae bacterium]|jgi:glycosyltransferase involved in cell wall biosynthesis|nr:glycosyltransferase [Dysgonamonadaceae bacterium]
MRILHIIFSLNIGGAENLLVDTLNEQVKSQTVALFIINDEYNPDLLAKINPDIPISLLKRKKGSFNLLKVMEANRTIRKYNPDVIHFHNHNGIRILTRPSLYRKVLTIHDVGILSNHLRKYDKILAISKAVQKDIFDRTNLESVLIYNGIDLSKIKIKTEKPTGIFRMVQVSRLEHLKKGQDILLKAIALLVDKYEIDSFSLDFIGAGSSEYYLKELIKQYNLEKFVTFTGEKRREDIYNNLHNYDLLIQPSIYEGFGLTVAEAMAARVPVLVSANDGPMEIIENGEYGFWFRKGDAEHCCEQIRQIILQREKLNIISDNAFQHVIKNFNIVDTASLYIQSYSK